jgi:hypothetical protein
MEAKTSSNGWGTLGKKTPLNRAREICPLCTKLVKTGTSGHLGRNFRPPEVPAKFRMKWGDPGKLTVYFCVQNRHFRKFAGTRAEVPELPANFRPKNCFTKTSITFASGLRF